MILGTPPKFDIDTKKWPSFKTTIFRVNEIIFRVWDTSEISGLEKRDLFQGPTFSVSK